jgi:response regulator RpfG family c-di-GMP phosphodiesterase
MSQDKKQSSQERFVALEANEEPALGTEAPSDLYVHLPRADKYIRFVLKGERWESYKKDMLKTHSDTSLYKTMTEALGDSLIDPQELTEKAPPEAPKIEKIFKAEPPVPDEIRIFKDEVNAELSQIFKSMGAPPNPKEASKTLKSLEKLSTQIIETVAPDVEDLRENILKNSKYLLVMADSAAITSISVLIAMAHGFNSRKIYRDLSTAALLMDAPLADIEEEQVLDHYKRLPSPPENPLIRNHPQKSYDSVSKKIKAIPEPVLQLILNHHELYNGKGYPRGIRNEQLPPVIRSLCLAVDVFEIMKQSKLRDNQDLDILGALEKLQEKDVEPHLRRHNQRLVHEAIEYTKLGSH